MPNIRLNLTQKITADQKQALAKELGEAVLLIPHKKLLILMIEDGKTVYIGGKEVDDYVLVELDVCGRFGIDIKSTFAKAAFAAITRILATPPDKLAMTIVQHDGWGNFGDFVDTDEFGDPIFR